MSSVVAQTYLTPEEYLAFERKAATKHEYLNGQIVAMSGASFAHNFITVNIATHLNIQLMNGECRVATSDMRVKVTEIDSYFYPDVVVVCGEPVPEDNVFDTLLNPTVIVEVLSPSTETYDRGEKFEHYQQIDSLKDYILISQDKIHVEHYCRQGSRWLQTEFQELSDVLSLRSIDCELRLQDVYRRVKV
ncbi:Uma2 family endonuclease, partial [Candidatus Poribacteria bacterium]|nr:Uma2 family endonuclease [Candidatus Poribacteria bacterium]